uniref:Uncharacterized protein n=1 Tax=Arundo donax TaxID=35708 RepID=A0A0A9BKG6_ARUDO
MGMRGTRSLMHRNVQYH